MALTSNSKAKPRPSIISTLTRIIRVDPCINLMGMTALDPKNQTGSNGVRVGLRFAIFLDRYWSGRLQSTAPWPEKQVKLEGGLYHVIKIPENRKSHA